eukprot:TRINITY_DN1937_c0_g1_i1.p1 TRINITY_DN1937_c0_g1~~TRINITY_DN1937_c0_g1_i1.p1  ORF type:complete len:354 (+),score=127.60 TRINITY_DN1937_c0_g1_i1:128-1189(+)
MPRGRMGGGRAVGARMAVGARRAGNNMGRLQMILDAAPQFDWKQTLIQTRDIDSIAARRSAVVAAAQSGLDEGAVEDVGEEQDVMEAEIARHRAEFARDEDHLFLLKNFIQVFNGDRGPEARMIKLSFVLRMLATVQLLVCFPLVILALLDRDASETIHEDIISFLLAFFAGIMGFYAGSSNSEQLSRVFFVFEIWLLFTLTQLLYTTVDVEQAQRRVCDPIVGDHAVGTDCSSNMSLVHAKLSFVFIQSFICAGGAFLGYDYNDAINDYQSIKPIIRAHQGADVWLNVDHPAYYARMRPERAGKKWHRRFKVKKSAPDMDIDFFDIAADPERKNAHDNDFGAGKNGPAMGGL